MTQRLDDAIRAPFDGDSTDTLVVGTLLTLASVSTPVLGVLLAGYAVRAIRRRARGDGLAAFDDWRGLAGDGVRVAAVTLPLHLPAVGVVALVGLDRTLMSISSLAHFGSPFLAPDYAAVAALLFVVVLELLAGYLSVAGLVRVAQVGSLRGYHVGDVVALARDPGFARAFALACVVGVVARLAGLAVAALPFVGVPLGAFVAFVGLVVAASVLAGVVPTDGDGRLTVSTATRSTRTLSEG
ncbi:DUF4013 domain-containing protein [Halogeometricum limi]|uniref:DUF4013 domain-containing protein n=1 Tax=Halogeometricum limi TaxID=555875 RepID=A0A1I6G4J1_9EURY|nr:DUF4013 domain-containing protein [Halogeometricum limi]SFR37115.1 Protein of unknown function [Halogeometricum limi]